MNSSALICLLLLMSTTDCATRGPSAVPSPVSPQSSLSTGRAGDLLVYSATYVQTLEQGEYPAHTNYTIATPDDKVIEHVSNATGSFSSNPARVSLPSGEYHVRAQYDRGGFIVVPVVIEAGKTTFVDLDGEALPQGQGAAKEMIRLPDGHVIGWRAIYTN